MKIRKYKWANILAAIFPTHHARYDMTINHSALPQIVISSNAKIFEESSFNGSCFKGINFLVVFLLGLLIGMTFWSSFVMGQATQSAFSAGSSSASYSRVATQPSFQTYYGSNVGTYWPVYGDAESCEARQDLLLNVAPLGCSPAVVRSDLLAEQDVPVFCQIDALKVNPLVDVTQVKNIRFSGTYPPEIKGSGFHPARAALRTQNTLLGSPLVNNIGYVVVVLKKQPDESKLPEFVNVTLSAQLEYAAQNVYGIGANEFLLEPTSDSDWEREKVKNSFWNGKYFVRLESVDENFATISIYDGGRKVMTQKVEKGKVSETSYLPGMYCRAGLQIAYDNFVSADEKARIEVSSVDGNDVFELTEGMRFLDNRCVVKSIDIESEGIGKVSGDCKGKSFVLELGARNSSGSSIVDRELKGDEKKYFEVAIENYGAVAKDYPLASEGEHEGARSYGEVALQEAIGLAEKFGMDSTGFKLINEYLEIYPDGKMVSFYLGELDTLYKIDSTKAGWGMEFDDKARTIRLLDLEKPKKKPSAELLLGGKTLKIERGEMKKLAEYGGGEQNITLENIDAGGVRVSANCIGSEKNVVRKSYELKVDGNEEKICGEVSARLDKISTEQVVKIRLIPFTGNMQGETNLTVGIGIEKRAIELTPEKAMEKIENLNRSIEKWESIAGNLAKVVKGLKGACFATAAVLTFKNFLTGLSGKAMARQEVMGGNDGWRSWCQKNLDKYDGSIDKCYLDNSDKIDKDVEIVGNAYDKVNEEIDKVQEQFKSEGGILGSSSIDQKKVRNALAEKIKNDERVGEDVKALLIPRNVDEGLVSTDALREIMLQAELKDKSVSAGQILNLEFERAEIIKKINDNVKFDNVRLRDSERRSEGLAPAFYGGAGSMKRAYVIPVSDVAKKSYIFGDLDYTATYVDKNAEEYVLGVEKKEGGVYKTSKVWKEDGTALEGDVLDKFISENRIANLKSIESLSYSNSMADMDKVVKYYDVEPYKGMPAVVPFDTRNGWYAGTRQTLPVFGGIGAFDASGRVTSFWLCNVGDNKRVEFETGFGDDICQQVNLNTGQPLGVFPGLDEGEAKSKINEAVKCVEQAARQYGNKIVDVCGERMRADVSVGTAETQCQDFMSPKDCHLMFNVCDPVICPASRCDFGGQYRVANVVQTGIVGSALLCLPNFKEGIVMPVCLTGIHAGIEGFVSIMRNYRDCLQESVDSGKMVGVCDQIYSVYTCEFFWGQVAPVVKVLLPKLLAGIYGQGARGGAEYMTVTSAWQNMQNSIGYFTQSYAVNSMNAFKVRSVEEAGGEVCKAWISTKAPDAFESLIEPDSPPQFHAWFDAKKYSDVTVPATSQYKVFYHIYAGNDEGVYYNVYLKNPPESGYYLTASQVPVASGFVARGEYASETKDFTAPEGYKELCVRVNNKEECGFKQVSTSFAVDYVAEKYAADEIASSDINSEEECVSGEANALALLTPNVQPGVEEVISPSVYERGIIRICSTQNPGLGTDASRFVEVGNCGDSKIKCWLDQDSVKNVIEHQEFFGVNDTLAELEGRTIAGLQKEGTLLSDDQAAGEIEKLGDRLKRFDGKEINVGEKILSDADAVFGKLIWDIDKVRVVLLKAQVNRKIALKLLSLEERDVGGMCADGYHDEDTEGDGVFDKCVADTPSSSSTPTPTTPANSETLPASDSVAGTPNGIPPPNEDNCKLDKPAWFSDVNLATELKNGDSVVEDKMVFLSARGNNACEGKNISFTIYEAELGEDDKQEPVLKVVMKDNKSFVGWNAKWIDDGFLQGNPEFYFVAQVEGDRIWTGKSAELKVSKSKEKTPQKEEAPEESNGEYYMDIQKDPFKNDGSEVYRFVDGNRNEKDVFVRKAGRTLSVYAIYLNKKNFEYVGSLVYSNGCFVFVPKDNMAVVFDRVSQDTKKVLEFLKKAAVLKLYPNSSDNLGMFIPPSVGIRSCEGD
ncbi:MAG: hypothetical protein ABIG28_01230 [archaeon]